MTKYARQMNCSATTNRRIKQARIRLDKYLLTQGLKTQHRKQSPSYLAQLKPPPGMSSDAYLSMLYVTRWFRFNLRQLLHEGMPRHSGNMDPQCNALPYIKEYIQELINLDHMGPNYNHPKVVQYRNALRQYVTLTQPRYGHLPDYLVIRTMCESI
jgi:hypothetical protein